LVFIVCPASLASVEGCVSFTLPLLPRFRSEPHFPGSKDFLSSYDKYIFPVFLLLNSSPVIFFFEPFDPHLRCRVSRLLRWPDAYYSSAVLFIFPSRSSSADLLVCGVLRQLNCLVRILPYPSAFPFPFFPCPSCLCVSFVLFSHISTNSLCLCVLFRREITKTLLPVSVACPDVFLDLILLRPSKERCGGPSKLLLVVLGGGFLSCIFTSSPRFFLTLQEMNKKYILLKMTWSAAFGLLFPFLAALGAELP